MAKKVVTKVATRKVTVLVRYEIKKSGTFQGRLYRAGEIVLYVRNDQGVYYYVTLRSNNIHSCTCQARKACYHIAFCKERENARRQQKLAQEVEQICAEVEHEISTVPASTPVPAHTPAPKAPARELAPLNGSRAFSILRR